MVDMDRYHRDKAFSRSVQKRLEKVSDKLEEWKRACADVSVTAASDNGDIKVTVNDRGTITALEVTEGTLETHTNITFEKRLNEVLAVARAGAVEEVTEIDGMIGTADFVAAFDRGLAENA